MRLFREDLVELKTRTAAGEFKTLGEAVRYTVSKSLTHDRMEKYGDDKHFREFKKAQLQVLEPLTKNVNGVESKMTSVEAEMTEIKKVFRETILELRGTRGGLRSAGLAGSDSTAAAKTEAAQPPMSAELQKELTLFRNLLGHINLTTTRTDQQMIASRRDTLGIKGLLAFLAVGIHSGSPRAAANVGEAKLFEAVERAVGELEDDTLEMLDEHSAFVNEESLVKKMARNLLAKVRQLAT